MKTKRRKVWAAVLVTAAISLPTGAAIGFYISQVYGTTCYCLFPKAKQSPRFYDTYQ